MEVYDKFLKAIENEEFSKLGEAIGYSVLNLAEVMDKDIKYEQLIRIIERVSENEELNDIINEKIQEELSQIPNSEMESEEEI